MKIGGWGRNRTGVRGVAVRCMTTLPPSQRARILTAGLVRKEPRAVVLFSQHCDSLEATYWPSNPSRKAGQAAIR